MNPRLADERLLTTPEAADFLRYSGKDAVKSFLKLADRHRLSRLKRGRVCLWRPSVLIAFLERDSFVVRRRSHGSQSATSAVSASSRFSREAVK